MKQHALNISTQGKGLYLITDKIKNALNGLPQSGLLNIFVHHTSASLLIQENADPSAREDLIHFFELLVPENQSWHTHTAEGPDDTTSHLKSALTQSSLNIPIIEGQIGLGTWQGVYLFEHRKAAHSRKLTLSILE